MYPGQPGDDEPGGMFRRTVSPSPYYDLYYENVGQFPDVHATVMQTDLAAGINLMTIRHIAEAVEASRRQKP
jgi:hypothetical protein